MPKTILSKEGTLTKGWKVVTHPGSKTAFREYSSVTWHKPLPKYVMIHSFTDMNQNTRMYDADTISDIRKTITREKKKHGGRFYVYRKTNTVTQNTRGNYLPLYEKYPMK